MSAKASVKLGYVSGVFGIQGWIKVFSKTEPRDHILDFASWLVGEMQAAVRYPVIAGGQHGKSIIAKLDGIDTREQAAGLVGQEIFIERAELPELPENQYYWVDLVGLQVFTMEGDSLGVVDSLLETGAHDVLVVGGERERLIPFVPDTFVKSVDMAKGRILVAWDPDF